MAKETATRTLPATYFALVKEFPLIPIRDDDHVDAARELIDRLQAEDRDEGAQEYLDAPADLVETYEHEHVLIPDASEAGVLRALRGSNGLSQPKLAKEVGISQSTLSAVLNGTRSLRFQTGPRSVFPPAVTTALPRSTSRSAVLSIWREAALSLHKGTRRRRPSASVYWPYHLAERSFTLRAPAVPLGTWRPSPSRYRMIQTFSRLAIGRPSPPDPAPETRPGCTTGCTTNFTVPGIYWQRPTASGGHGDRKARDVTC
jgi:antitoxin component HigA of HigAB toxin-antitoxin module